MFKVHPCPNCRKPVEPEELLHSEPQKPWYKPEKLPSEHCPYCHQAIRSNACRSPWLLLIPATLPVHYFADLYLSDTLILILTLLCPIAGIVLAQRSSPYIKADLTDKQ